MASSSLLKELPTSDGDLAPPKTPIYSTTMPYATLPQSGFVHGSIEGASTKKDVLIRVGSENSIFWE
jgi:hypothetical protein